MTLQELKENRNEIIEIIERISEHDLKTVMQELVNVSNTGMPFDIEDVEDVIRDIEQELNEKIIREGVKASHKLEEINIEMSKRLMQNI